MKLCLRDRAKMMLWALGAVISRSARQKKQGQKGCFSWDPIHAWRTLHVTMLTDGVFSQRGKFVPDFNLKREKKYTQRAYQNIPKSIVYLCFEEAANDPGMDQPPLQLTHILTRDFYTDPGGGVQPAGCKKKCWLGKRSWLEPFLKVWGVQGAGSYPLLDPSGPRSPNPARSYFFSHLAIFGHFERFFPFFEKFGALHRKSFQSSRNFPG